MRERKWVMERGRQTWTGRERETDRKRDGRGSETIDGETSEREKGIGRLRAGEWGLGEWRQKKRNKKQRLKGLPWWSSGQDCAPNVGGPGSIPGQGTRPHMPQLRVCMPQLKIPSATTKIWFSQIN